MHQEADFGRKMRHSPQITGRNCIDKFVCICVCINLFVFFKFGMASLVNFCSLRGLCPAPRSEEAYFGDFVLVVFFNKTKGSFFVSQKNIKTCPNQNSKIITI